MKELDIFLPALVCLVFASVPPAYAQPASGDVFREHRYNCSMDLGGYQPPCSAGKALRVGPCVEPFCTDKGTCNTCQDIILANDVDLNNAIRAEVVLEKVLCHDSTTGLRIQFNSKDWISIPEAPGVPLPPELYQHHIYPVVEVPLDHLSNGTNVFQMRVNEDGWWPQNLINGVHLRIYYDPQSTPHPSGKVSSPIAGATLGMKVDLSVQAQPPAGGSIEKVDYLGFYQDVNWEGDGVYRQWHYIYDHGELIKHLGSASSPPYQANWDTTWVPDQPEAMKILAWITDEQNITFVTEALPNLSLDRGGDYSVELCKPYNIPQKWVTRKGNHEENFDVSGDLSKAQAAQLVWVSWCPGYAQGVFINDTTIVPVENDWPFYRTFHHRYDFDNTSAMQNGANVLRTGATTGGGKHGMEVNYPGIMVLVQYGESGPVTTPTVRFTQPQNQATVSGLVPVALEANDPDGSLSLVELSIGNRFAFDLTGGPYQAQWDSAQAYDGLWAMEARVLDDAGAEAIARIQVELDNQRPILLADSFSLDSPDVPWESWSGNWSVQDGSYQQADQADHQFAVAGDPSWRDYAMEFKIKLSADSSGGTGAMFRVNDENNLYLVEINPGSKQANLWLRQDGNWTNLRNTTMSFAPTADQWHVLRIEAEGSSLRAYLDGWMVIEVNDSTHFAGKIGLKTSGRTWFDNVKVSSKHESQEESSVETDGGSDAGEEPSVQTDGGTDAGSDASEQSDTIQGKDELQGSCACGRDASPGQWFWILGLTFGLALRSRHFRSQALANKKTGDN